MVSVPSLDFQLYSALRDAAKREEQVGEGGGGGGELRDAVLRFKRTEEARFVRAL